MRILARFALLLSLVIGLALVVVPSATAGAAVHAHHAAAHRIAPLDLWCC